MESEDIGDPPVIKQMLKDLAKQQASLNSRRIKLLEQLRSVVCICSFEFYYCRTDEVSFVTITSSGVVDPKLSNELSFFFF